MARENTGVMGLAKETTYDTAVSPAHIFYCTEARHSSAVDGFDEAETANGSAFSTGLTGMADMTRLNIRSVGHDEALAGLAATALGSDTVTTPASATAARQHKIVPMAVSSELASYTIQASVTTKSETTIRKATRYSGGICNSFTMGSSVRDKPLRIAAEYAVSGTQAAGVTLASASIPNYGPFKHNNVYCFIGTAFVPGSLNLPVHTGTAEAPSGVEVTGAVDWSKYIRGYSLTVNNNVDQESGHSGSTGLVATSMFIGRPTISLSLTLRFAEGDTDMLALVDGDKSWTRTIGLYCWSNTFIEDVTTDYQYAYSLFTPKVIQSGPVVWGSNSLGVREITVPFTAIDNLTQNVVELYVWNKDATAWT